MRRIRRGPARVAQERPVSRPSTSTMRPSLGLSPGTWGVLQSHTSATLDQKIRGTGWSCFFMAAEVKATVLGALAAKSIRRALKQIFLRVRKPDFNCLEVTRIFEGRFFGVPYITVSAHSRHIQQGSLMEFAEGSNRFRTVFESRN